MFRRNDRRGRGYGRVCIAIAASVAATTAAIAQTPPPESPAAQPTAPTSPTAPVSPPTLVLPAPSGSEEISTTADSVIEDYLADRGLQDLLTAHLRRRLAEASEPDRVQIAERLGRMYVERLSKVVSSDERRELEQQSRELLKMVPDADSFELRIDLAKVSYLRAETMAERERLLLATPEERQEAERVLRAAAPMFQEIGLKVNRRVETLERREQSGRDEESVREQLAEARRLRSLAMYYNGWTNYYLAYLTNNPGQAIKALEDFGYLLNASPGRAASVDRMPKALLKYEHVARAAVGCALCSAMRPGGDVEAMRWLDAVEAGESVPPVVSADVFRHRATVLAGARRWADLEFVVRRRLRPPRDGPAIPLNPLEARLLAVLTLEASASSPTPARSGESLETLAQVALGELVSQGRVGDVVDLVNRFGTAPIGQEGFVVQFVRGLQAYEKARKDHSAAGSPDDPSTDPGICNRYREAAGVLALATQSADAKKFDAERARASMLLGLSLYYAGESKAAAAEFQRTAESAPDPKLKQEAMWYSIVALDHAVDGGERGMISERDRVAALFLNAFPRSENAAKLLLRRAGAGFLGEDATIKVLSDVSIDSPLYGIARRQIAEIQYKQFRKAAVGDRESRARAFMETADEALKLAVRDATVSDAGAAGEPAQGGLRTARQLTEVALSLTPPDIAHAEAALESIDRLCLVAKLDLTALEDELAFRRLQIAVERDRTEQVESNLAKLRAHPSQFTLVADRLVFRNALNAWRSVQTPETASGVVRHGVRVADALSTKPGATDDPATQSVFNDVAEAAALLWKTHKNESARDLALRLDRMVAASTTPTGAALKRLADLSEDSGDFAGALAAWRRLLSGIEPSKPAWMEARFHSIRLLAKSDPSAAMVVLRQHKLLNPDLGPEPWGTKFRELESELERSQPAATDPSTGPPAKSGGRP